MTVELDTFGCGLHHWRTLLTEEQRDAVCQWLADALAHRIPGWFVVRAEDNDEVIVYVGDAEEAMWRWLNYKVVGEGVVWLAMQDAYDFDRVDVVEVAHPAIPPVIMPTYSDPWSAPGSYVMADE